METKQGLHACKDGRIMMQNVFTFWEGKMPAYISLCMRTWKVSPIILNYHNLGDWTDLSVDKLQGFTLPQIADCIRVHVLRDNGGYWLDTDTIMLSNLPTENICGYSNERTNTIGFLHTEPHSDMFEKWAKYQDHVIENKNKIVNVHKWDIFGNRFTDDYVKTHTDIKIHDVTFCWPETYMIDTSISRHEKYKKFYFNMNFKLSDIIPTRLLMLHNSWTPSWYKNAESQDVLSYNVTLSNILRELLS